MTAEARTCIQLFRSSNIMNNKFFCPLPWNHLMFRSNGNVQACCEGYKDPFKMSGTIAETANNSIMKKLRLELLDPDTVPSLCWKCENREKFQDRSVRKYSLESYWWWDEQTARQATNEDGSMDDFHLEYLDIRWSNLCNYRCRFCGLSSSNLWLKEESQRPGKIVGPEYNPKTGVAEFDMDWEDFKTHLPYVKKIKMAGGEPTIMPGTYQMLEELVNIGNTELSLSLITNGAVVKYGKYDLLELLSHFNKNTKAKGVIQISAEGMGQRHAWARSAKDDWHIVDANIKKYKEFVNSQGPNWSLIFHTGISWMNMYHLADMVEQYNEIDFNFNIVSDPATMSIQCFYKSELERASEFYSKRLAKAKGKVRRPLTIIKNAIDSAITVTKDDIDLDKFKKDQNWLDTSRSQSFVEAYPEWSHLYE